MKKVKRTKEKIKLAPFDTSEHLDSEEVIEEYLNAALEDPNPGDGGLTPCLRSARRNPTAIGQSSRSRPGPKSQVSGHHSARHGSLVPACIPPTSEAGNRRPKTFIQDVNFEARTKRFVSLF
jgi:hypothetical protein